MRWFQIIVIALAISLLPRGASANLPFLLVSLEAQRVKCASQHPQLRPELEAAFKGIAARPPEGISVPDWTALLATGTLSVDPLSGTISVEECRSFIAHVERIDFNAVIKAIEKDQADFEALRREAESEKSTD